MRKEKQCRLRLKMNDDGKHFLVDDRGYRLAGVRSIKSHQEVDAATACTVEFFTHDDDANRISGSDVKKKVNGVDYDQPENIAKGIEDA